MTSESLFNFLNRVLTGVLLTLISSPFLYQTASADISLKFGVYTSEKASTIVRQFRPLLYNLEQSMSDKLGEKVTISMNVAPDYVTGRENLIRGHVDFSRLGPASYVLAKNREPDISILTLENDQGSKSFHGVIAVHSDSAIQQVSDLKGRRLAFGDENSTNGRYLPQLTLINNGIFSTDLQEYDYLGRHDRVGMAVINKEYDAGAMNENVFNRLVKQGYPLRIIASWPTVTGPWVARKGLDPRLFDTLRSSMLSISDPLVLRAMKKNGFLAGGDEDMQQVRKATLMNKNFFKKQLLNP